MKRFLTEEFLNECEVLGTAQLGNETITYYVQRFNPPHIRFGKWAIWKASNIPNAILRPSCIYEAALDGAIEKKSIETETRKL